jgi:arylsulfatase A-like enzyme
MMMTSMHGLLNSNFEMKIMRYILVAILFYSTILSAQKKPNIVWLTTEDNSHFWYQLYNKEGGAKMPHIEKLAENGLVFNNAYSCAPVCSAARSTIISGVYGTKTGAHYHRRLQRVDMPGDLKGFPYYLKKAGYYTSNNKKTDYNYDIKMNELWDESSSKASFRHRKPGQPFFHVQNWTSTHEGPLFGESKHKGSNRPEDVKLFPYHPDTPLFRQKYAQYLDTHERTDALIGQFIEDLEKENLLDDTFIFHYGDHGGVLPGSKGYAHESGLHVAMVVYIPENFKHLVPSSRGTRVDGFVEFVDLSATVLNIAGLEIPKEIDGRPFLGKGVELKELNQRNTAFGYAARFDEKYDMVRFLRKDKYTYRRSYQPFNVDGLQNNYRYRQPAFQEWRELYREGHLNAHQKAFFERRPPEALYDIENDPYELNNLAENENYASVLIDMRKTLQARVKAMPDIGFYPEPFLIQEAKQDFVGYGERHQADIIALSKIADLQLQPYLEARGGIKEALDSEKPMERYWGLITCSAFGDQAVDFIDHAKEIAIQDSNVFVRTRAVEFLGITGSDHISSKLIAILNDSKDENEVNMILNTAVLLKDHYDVELDLDAFAHSSWAKEGKYVKSRLSYLLEK